MVTNSKPTPGAPHGAPTTDTLERLSAPFAESEVRVRRGPRGDMRYITARTARRSTQGRHDSYSDLMRSHRASNGEWWI